MAQQILFKDPVDYFSGSSFNNRYTELRWAKVLLNERQPFKEKRVRKISIYNWQDSLIWFFELDRSGNTVGEGWQGAYYFRTMKRKFELPDTFECKTWSTGEIVMRKDTQEAYHKIYRNADTLMEYDEYNITVYKRGKLINEQNAWYTRKYLSRRESFKADYDSLVLFMCSRNYYRENFMASVKDKKINLDTNSLREHPFFKKYRRPAFRKYFVEGENFIEPTQQPFTCGNLMQEPQGEHTLNSNGLLDKYSSGEGNNKRLVFYAKYEYYEKP